MNLQFLNMPYFPFHCIAPPDPVKLKFQKEKKSYQHDCFKECLSLEKIKILRKIAIKYPIQAIKINFFKKNSLEGNYWFPNIPSFSSAVKISTISSGVPVSNTFPPLIIAVVSQTSSTNSISWEMIINV